MLKRIAIVTGLFTVLGAHAALATPTLDLGGVPPMPSAREVQPGPQAAGQTNRGSERFVDSGTRVQSPKAPFYRSP